MVDAPSPFSPTLPNFQLFWDSTSLGWFKRCPRYYQYSMLEHWQPRHKSIHLDFGGWYAGGMERYSHAKASGQSHTESQITMLRWVLSVSGTRDEEGVWTPWSPGDHPDANIKNRYTLVRSLIWATEDRQSSPFHTVILANGKPAVELSFTFPAFVVEGEQIYLSGHLDDVVEANRDTFIADDKTSKNSLDAYFARGWTPNNQMSLYSIAGRVVLNSPIRGVLIRGAQIGVNFTRYRTHQVPRPQAVLDEWMVDAQHWITAARTCAVNNHWPQNDTACSMYGGCTYQKVCSVSPSHRQAWLQDDYEKRAWNPREARGEV